MIIEKLFTQNRFTRKFVITYLKRKEGGEWKSTSLRKLFKKYRNFDVGFASYGWAHDGVDGPITIGKYVSIGQNFRRISVNHPTDGVTTHPCWFNPDFGWTDNDFRKRQHLTIGNDVWIGDNVTITPGCRSIGDGVIVAAGAIVTKDIPSFEIWGGVPAKFIKKRFDQEISDKLSEIKWWDLSEEELKKHLDDFSNPEEFIKNF